MRVWSRVAAVVLLAVAAGCTDVVSPVDPAGATWESLPDAPLSARHEAVGVWTGQVFLIVGGDSGPPCPPNAGCTAPVEPPMRDGAAYDPGRKAWQKLPDAPVPVSAFGNAVVVRGSLYLLTYEVGRADSPQTMLRFDAGSRVWDRLPLPPSSSLVKLTAAGDRLVAVAGTDEHGPTVDSWFDESARKWLPLPADPLGSSFGREAVWTDDGLVLGAAALVPNPGSEEPAVVRLARLEPSWRRWSLLGDTEIIGGTPVAVDERVVWPMSGSADGGEVNNWGRSYPFGGILDPAEMTWSPLPEPSAPDSGLVGYPVTVGDSLLVDGQLLRPSTQTWTTVPPGPWRAKTSMTAVGSEDSLLVWGGATDTDNTDEGYLLRLD